MTSYGNVASKTQSSGGVTLTTNYAYDAVGRLASVTYPSGLVITPSYLVSYYGNPTQRGQITAIDSSRGPIASAIEYLPFGGAPNLWTFANNERLGRGYTPDGRLVSYFSYSKATYVYSDMNYLAYDYAGRLTGITNTVQPATNRAYGYDALNRLSAFNPVSGSAEAWTYDANGNRESETLGGTTKDYVVDPASNILRAIDAATLSYDAAGNTLNDGTHTYQYDQRNRLTVIDAGTQNELRYVMNALGQRVAKLGIQPAQPGDANHDGRVSREDVYLLNDQLLQRRNAPGNPDCNNDGAVNTKDTLCINNVSQTSTINYASTKTNYAYDEAGHLIGEYDASGGLIQETVWLGDIPVATLNRRGVFYIHADHLNTPRIITDKNQKVVWTWNSDPFGSTAANEDPDSDGEKFVYNLRFPGQVYDQESGLHYNYFRTYNPATGRYVQSDPIGLLGGLNTFGYVGQNPFKWVDPAGLARKWVKLGEGYSGAIDTFPVNGESGFEIHVYDSNGDLVGMYGPEGWFDKHGVSGKPEGIPDSVEAQCKGKAVDIGRRMGKIPDQGWANIKGDRWKKFFKRLPLLGPLIEITKPSPERACEIYPNADICL